MKINLRAMMLASGLIISMIPFMPGEASAEEISVPDSRKLSDITYMQDMSGQICENTSENATKQLIDTRDGKSYWVTKLKDNNCWMTQNLDLDIPAEGLSAKDTDIPVDWNSSSTYKPEATQTTASPSFGTTNNNIKSWNPGANGGEKYCNTSGCNLTTSSNNGHDAQGNYYSWGAATAGQAATLTSTSAGEQSTQSICPKGWTLPTSGESDKQYSTLLSGLTVAQITANPYHFVYSGLVNNNYPDFVGSRGHYWSSIAYNNINAYNLYFVTDINSSSASSRYLGFSVRCVARPKESKKTLSDLTYMQEMTTGVCEKSSENETKQLIDQRDGKTYWVAKLRDGNCWMTQNLDLDLNGRKLTSADSDVLSDWTSTTGASGLWTGNSSDYNVVKYYDPGDYFYTTPTTQNGCNSSTGLTGCTSKGWQSTSGMSASDDPNFTGVVSGNTYNAHYLAGNYYSWGAATAGQAASLTSSTAGELSTQSICPKGWRLPLSKDSNNAVSDSFYYLLNKYGLTSSLTSGNNDIRLAPLYFVYGGNVDNSSLYGAGSQGLYWSSTAYTASDAWYLVFGTSVYPSYSNPRYYGFSVRCVSRADIPDNNDNVTITITPTLSLDVAATTEIPYTAGGISTGSLSATVKSNQQHTIQLSATQPNLVNEADNSKIIPADAGVSAGTSAWGIKKKESAAGTSLGSTTDVSAYTALTSTPDIFYRSAAGSEGTAPINFTVGISTDSSVASGTYSTNVTVTATTI